MEAAPDRPAPPPPAGSTERVAQELRRLSGGIPRSVGVGQRVQHHEVVDRPRVADRCHVDPRAAQVARVGLPLVAQDIALAVDDFDSAREAVLARIPAGASVMTNTSVTLQETGIADAINSGGEYESARNKMLSIDFATQAREMKAVGGQPDYSLGSVHAVTRKGTLVIASASGSQLGSYAWGAGKVIFVIGAQKLVARPRAFPMGEKPGFASRSPMTRTSPTRT